MHCTQPIAASTDYHNIPNAIPIFHDIAEHLRFTRLSKCYFLYTFLNQVHIHSWLLTITAFAIITGNLVITQHGSEKVSSCTFYYSISILLMVFCIGRSLLKLISHVMKVQVIGHSTARFTLEVEKLLEWVPF